MDDVAAKMPVLLVILLRVSAVLVAVPFFGQRVFSVGIKMAFAFLVSLLLLPAAPAAGWPLPGSVLGLVAFLLQELVVGLSVGLTVLLLLTAIEVVGQLLSFQMAFSMSTVLDPTMGAQSNVISAVLVMAATLLFLMLGGDHIVLGALAKSFQVLPPGSLRVSRGALDLLHRLLSHALTTGVQLAAPVVILLLAVDFTLSLVSRAAAKMQIFFVGLPLKIALGLVGTGLLLGVVLNVWTREVNDLPRWLSSLFRLLRAAHG